VTTDKCIFMFSVLWRKKNASGSREQKKLQRTGNSCWLVCAADLDCSHLLMIVAIGIAHVMLATQCKARLTMLCICPVIMQPG